jgi:hypothetical protein
MGLYDILFLTFCVILFLLIFLGVSKNALTKYGVGLLIGILVLGVVSYDIWANLQVREVTRRIDLTGSDAERQILLQKLMKYFGDRP